MPLTPPVCINNGATQNIPIFFNVYMIEKLRSAGFFTKSQKSFECSLKTTPTVSCAGPKVFMIFTSETINTIFFKFGEKSLIFGFQHQDAKQRSKAWRKHQVGIANKKVRSWKRLVTDNTKTPLQSRNIGLFHCDQKLGLFFNISELESDFFKARFTLLWNCF